jgi:PAS domain S-box-containing protein
MTPSNSLLRFWTWQNLCAVLLVAIAYAGVGRIVFQFASLPGGITPIWPPSGIALAAVFLLGPAVAPGIGLGVLLLLTPASFSTWGVIAQVAIALGSILEVLVMSYVLQRLLPIETALTRSRDTARFTMLAFLGPIIGTTIGTFSTCLAGLDPWSDFPAIWGGWWISNAFGILVFTPALVSWYRHFCRDRRWTASLGIWLERFSMIVLAIAVCYIVFRHSLPLEYVLLPILMWGTFRFGLAFAMMLVIVSLIIAVVGTIGGSGPFVDESRPESTALLLLQAFIGVVTLTVLVLSTVISERQAANQQRIEANQALADMAEQLKTANLALAAANGDLAKRVEKKTQALESSEDKFSKVFGASPNPIVISRLSDGTILDINKSFLTMSGYERDDVVGHSALDLGLWVNPDLRTGLIERLRQTGAIRDYEAEFRMATGAIRYGLLAAEIITLDHDICLVTLVNDITDRKRAELALRHEQEKSEQLLLNILPQTIADRLKQDYMGQHPLSTAIAEHYEEVSILFADIVGFTSLSARLDAIAIVNLLNRIFSTFDQLAEQLGLEKIKTIGDAYMVASGLPNPRTDHAEAIAEMALEMTTAMQQFEQELDLNLKLRIGINSGIVVAGVIGKKKFIYDLWGDAVNVASRMESLGEPGSIQVTESTYQLLKESYELRSRGSITVKGKGMMNTYWLVGKRAIADYSHPTLESV